MRTHAGRPGVAPETLQAIAAARARHPELTMQAFAQLLFDEGIYRGRARDGRPVPAGLCRKLAFLRPNAKIGCQKINDLRD